MLIATVCVFIAEVLVFATACVLRYQRRISEFGMDITAAGICTTAFVWNCIIGASMWAVVVSAVFTVITFTSVSITARKGKSA